MQLENYSRIKKLQKELKKGESYLVESPIDLYYLTGLDLSLGFLLIGKDAFKLFLDGRYLEYGKELNPLFLSDENIKQWLKEEAIQTIFVDPEQITLSHFDELKEKFDCISKGKNLDRTIKDAGEIALMEKSAQLIYSALEMVPTLLKEGIKEKEIALELERWIKERGATSFGFDPIIAFGKNSALPHHRAGESELKKGDIVLVDMGCTLNHYQSDMTRVFFFGAVDTQLQELYNVTFSAQKAALKKCRPGVWVGELDLAARAVMGSLEDKFIHSLGHGIGLEVHEFPRISKKAPKEMLLEEGMVITIEPGLYLPGLGGVRYEDTVVITKDGYRNFYPEIFNPDLLSTF